MDAADKANLKLRVLSAVVLIPLTVFVLYQGGVLFYIFLVSLFGLSLWEWFGLAVKTDKRVLFLIAGFVYLLLSFYALFRIQQAFDVALLFVGMVWASDIGAYIFGKWIGGKKMAPKVSPNKTWAGLIGAILFPFLVFVVWFIYFEPFVFDITLAIGFGFVVTVFFAVACQAGDLLVSYLKRQAKVKDTGVLIPGHGGVLDRIDSLLMGGIFMLLLSYVS